jgi:SAM-dependent methyltransferase
VADAGGADSERTSRWQSIWDETWRSGDGGEFSGWISSYTGEPIPEADMREWLNHTVERILSLQPRRVLEIGCGNGLILKRVAPSCAQYCATDFSQQALQHLQASLDLPLAGCDVSFKQLRADEIGTLPSHAFDTIIINSVVQYLPDVETLMRVLELAFERLSPGGSIFVGDVLNHELMNALHFSLELHQAGDERAVAEISQRAARRSEQEEELFVAPQFFAALRRKHPQISSVRLLPKVGRADNEITRFRYDAVLSTAAVAARPGTSSSVDWQQKKLSLANVLKLLTEERPAALRVTNIPDARVLPHLRAMELASDERGEVGMLRARISADSTLVCHPQEFHDLAQSIELSAEITCGTQPGTFDCLVTEHGVLSGTTAHFEPSVALAKGWNEYANTPARAQHGGLQRELRSFLQQRLPDHMIPSAFIVLQTLPLTPNGKIDRRALPDPVQTEDRSPTALQPANVIESALCSVWSEILDVQSIGVTDNFFERGGHSLLATQLISRLRSIFQIDLPLRAIFESPTVRQLAAVLQAREPQPGQTERIATLLKRVETMSPEALKQTLEEKRATLSHTTR